MPDMRYVRNEEKFLDYAWSVFAEFFGGRTEFDIQFHTMPEEPERNRFLKLASFYKFLVRDGNFQVTLSGEQKRITYIDQTYKFVAITSFIEALYEKEEFIEFYDWLKRSAATSFPIEDKESLDEIYRKYKENHGSITKIKRFFNSLDNKAQNFLTARITVKGEYLPIDRLASFLYEIRSEFVHRARLVLEFDEGTVLSSRQKRQVVSILSFNDLQLIFEDGFLQHFGFAPSKRKI